MPPPLSQAYNKKDHKHTVKYDTDGAREMINLISTARKWEIDTDPPPPKKPEGEGGNDQVCLLAC